MANTEFFKDLELHYFLVKGNPITGRGETVRLLLEDAGIEYKYCRYSFGTWPDKKKSLTEEGIREPTMPFIVAGGKHYAKTMPLMRMLSKKLGKYEGANDEENHLLDVYSDMVTDWGNKWAISVFIMGGGEALEKHGREEVPKLYKTWNDVLSDAPNGPYLLGDRVSYADFALYHILEDDKSSDLLTTKANDYPHIHAFMKEIESRPKLSKYFATDRG